MPRSGSAAKPPAPPALLESRGAVWLAGCVLLLTTLAVYLNAFAVPFTFDDTGAIRDNTTILRLWPLWEALTPPHGLTVGGRPVLNFSFALNYAISGNAVWSYHTLNLAIHLLAGLILFGVVRRTLQQPALRGRLGGAALPLALAVALLWTLHPLQTEAVTYLSQRAESLMGLFYLLTLYGFIRGVTCHLMDDKSDGGGRAAIWHVLAVMACLLGMATKEVMVSAPLMVLLYDRTFVAGSFGEAWRRRRRLYLGLAATWILLGWLAAGEAGRGGTAGFGAGVSWPAYVLTQCRAIPHYLRLACWPHPLVFDYGTAVAKGPAEVAPFALILALLAAGTLYSLRRRPALGFAGVWFFAILAPSSSVVPVATQTVAEHRMYLPLAAVITLIVAGIYALTGWRSLIAFLVAALGLGWLTVHRNEDYRSSLAIWSDTVAKRPDNARAHNNLGFALFEAGKASEAISHYERALQIKPDYAEAHNNLGNVLAFTGRPAEAIGQFREALGLHFHSAEVYYNLANALAQMGRLEESIAQYEEALRLKPDFSAAHNNLGSALARLGRTTEAAAEFRESVRLDPDNANACNNLGNTLLQLGRVPEAINSYQQALQLDPANAETHFNLGNALVRSGRTSEAIRQYEIALELRPDFALARNHLARLRIMEQTARPRE